MKLERLLKILIFVILIILLYMSTVGSTTFVLKLNWGVKLPREDKFVYHKDWGTEGFHGDGIKYTILKYKSNRKIKKLDNIDWKYQKDKSVETKVLKLLDIIDIDKKYTINFDEEYLYYIQEGKLEEMFIIYMQNQHELYIIENVR